MIIDMIRLIILYTKIPNFWEMNQTILIHKAGFPKDPVNWRPITLRSMVYPIIFGRIDQIITSFGNRSVRSKYYHSLKMVFYQGLTDVENTQS
jgi:hypothetical protein